MLKELGFTELAYMGFELVAIVALLALPVAFVITLALIRLFRKSVGHSMQATAGASTKSQFQECLAATSVTQGGLEIKAIVATRERARAARTAPLVAQARRREWGLAAVYAGATSIQPFILTAALTAAHSTSKYQIFHYIIFYGVLFLQNGTPVALAATMVLTRQLRFLIFAVLALIVALWACEWAIAGTDAVGLWLMIAGLPTAIILMLNAHRIRAVGPMVFAVTLFFFYDIAVGLALNALYVGDVVGPVRFVREDLAQLPLVTAVERYSSELFNLPPREILETLKAVASDPSRTIHIGHRERWTTGYQLLFIGSLVITAGLGVVVCWAFVWWLANHYRTRRASDQMLNIDVLMVIFTLWLFMIFFSLFGFIGAVCTLAGFAGYKLFTRWLLQRHRRFATPEVPRTLLLLRVFRSGRRAQSLLEKLIQRWRYFGPVRMIAGTDLVNSTIEPHEFYDFLGRRLTRSFVKDKEDLDHRLSEHILGPDPDGLYRIEDFFCHDDTWQMTVSALARKADIVLMDLRGFNCEKRGCAFEIEMLIQSVPVKRIVFLVDDSTDSPFLEQTLHRAWRNMPSNSPNAGSGRQQIRLIQATGHRRTLDSLLGFLCEGFA
jgi:hypothetical protein